MRYRLTADCFVGVCPTRATKGTKRNEPQKGTKVTKRKQLMNQFFYVTFVPFCGSFYEAVADCVVGQLGVGSHVHLVEDATTIRADGFVAE